MLWRRYVGEFRTIRVTRGNFLSSYDLNISVTSLITGLKVDRVFFSSQNSRLEARWQSQRMSVQSEHDALTGEVIDKSEKRKIFH